MIYGIEESTDHRSPQTKVVKFTTETAAKKWASVSGGLSFPGAATTDIPECSQNWHHTFRHLYRPRGAFRLDMRIVKKKYEAQWSIHGMSGSYLRPKMSFAASMIEQNCDEIG